MRSLRPSAMVSCTRASYSASESDCSASSSAASVRDTAAWARMKAIHGARRGSMRASARSADGRTAVSAEGPVIVAA